ncbi:hypothetical protein ACTFWN_29630, partial [Klebsiella pneumoniae]
KPPAQRAGISLPEGIPAAADIVNLRYKSCSEMEGQDHVDGLPGSQLAAINTDGDYIVGSIDYTGDTRGQAWYMDLLCLAKGARELQSLSTLNKVG